MIYQNLRVLSLALVAALAVAHDANIQRHVVVDDKARRSSMMRQETSTKKDHRGDMVKSAEAADHERDDDVRKIEDLLKESDAHKKESDAILKESSAKMLKDEDKRIFQEADEDQNGHLDGTEVDKVLNKAGLSETDFDWRAHDQDQDGKLSEDEFLAASEAAGHHAKPRSLSLLEDYILRTHGPSKLMKLKDFKRYDSDGSGALEDNEASSLTKGVGLREDSWRKFDLNGDGKFSEEEFNKDLAALTKDTMSAHRGVDQDHAVFQEADSNGSSFLEESEVNSLLDQIHALHDHPFNWHQFDYDKDGRLSELEFMQAGPAVVEAVRRSSQSSQTHPASFAQESEWEDEHEEADEQDEEESQDEDEDQDEDENENGEFDENEYGEFDESDDDDVKSHVAEDFKIADKDHDGFLNADELKSFAQEVSFPAHFDWRVADADGDGKLNEEELFNLARLSSQEEKIDPEPDDEEEEHKHMQ